ncbi:MAG: glutaredoxin [Eubacteriales bacterium]|jgi:glutaredoxin|nr:glutaredoxin [Clostridiales bacterium]
MELLLFILKNCPYCIEALKWIEELKDENPEYSAVKLKIIDERTEAELANSYDYYYVPTFFYGKHKLHEGAATKDKIRRVFDEYIKLSSQQVPATE